MAELQTIDRSEDRRKGYAFVGVMVALMWAVEIADVIAFEPDDQGIRPRDLEGLLGVLLSPFLHGGFGHLIGNTIPYAILGCAIALGGLARVLAVTAIVVVLGGLGTWLTAPESTIHIGASGVVFGYASYLITRGAFSRRALHLFGGLAVLAIYGTTLLIGLVPTPGVSWQGHFFGAVSGVVAARALHARRPG